MTVRVAAEVGLPTEARGDLRRSTFAWPELHRQTPVDNLRLRSRAEVGGPEQRELEPTVELAATNRGAEAGGIVLMLPTPPLVPLLQRVRRATDDAAPPGVIIGGIPKTASI